MYAVFKTGGKQYRVAAGDKLRVEKLPGNVGDAVAFQEVLLVADETVNTMPDATLTATLDHGNFSSSTLLNDASIDEAAGALDQLPENISLAEVTEKLEVDGVSAFVASYEELLKTVAEKIQHHS